MPVSCLTVATVSQTGRITVIFSADVASCLYKNGSPSGAAVCEILSANGEYGHSSYAPKSAGDPGVIRGTRGRKPAGFF